MSVLEPTGALVSYLIDVSVGLPCFWATVLLGVCEHAVQVLFLKSKVDSLRLLLLNFKSAKNRRTTPRWRLAVWLSERRFLNLGPFRDVTLGRLLFVLYFSTALSWSFWSGISALTFVNVDLRTVNFSTVDVRVLQCHNLAFVSPGRKVRSLRRGFSSGLVVQLSVCKSVVHLYILGRRSLWWVSCSTRSYCLVLL